MLKNINTKEENRKIMRFLEISEEKAKDMFVLTKAFKKQNRAEQGRLCSKYNLPQGRTYGCWKHANSFGDFLAKVFAKGGFVPLEEIGNNKTLGVFKKCPEFDPEKGWILPEYIQVRQEGDEEVHYEPIRDYLQDKGLTPELEEFCVEFQTCRHPELGWDIGLDILNLARWDKVLPEYKSEDLKERLQELSNGDYTTPPAIGEERYDNATEAEVWELEDENAPVYGVDLNKVLSGVLILENSLEPRAVEIKKDYFSSKGLNIPLLWSDLQIRGMAETLAWTETEPGEGMYEEKTLYALRGLRSLWKEELTTLLDMREDVLLKKVGMGVSKKNPCTVRKMTPEELAKAQEELAKAKKKKDYWKR